MEIDRRYFFVQSELDGLDPHNVEQGLRARIEPQGITGLNYRNKLREGPSQFPSLAVDWQPHYYYIPSAPASHEHARSINKIMRQVEELNRSGMTRRNILLETQQGGRWRKFRRSAVCEPW
jgi:hypothetical protein